MFLPPNALACFADRFFSLNPFSQYYAISSRSSRLFLSPRSKTLSTQRCIVKWFPFLLSHFVFFPVHHHNTTGPSCNTLFITHHCFLWDGAMA